MSKIENTNIQTITNLYFNRAPAEITSRYIHHPFFIKGNELGVVSMEDATISSSNGWLGTSIPLQMASRNWQLFNMIDSLYVMMPDYSWQETYLWVEANNAKLDAKDKDFNETTRQANILNNITAGLANQVVAPFTSDEPHLSYMFKIALLKVDYFKLLLEKEVLGGPSFGSSFGESMKRYFRGQRFEEEEEEEEEIDRDTVVPMDITLLDERDKTTTNNICDNPSNSYLCYASYSNKSVQSGGGKAGSKTKRNRKKLSKNKNRKTKRVKTKKRRTKK